MSRPRSRPKLRLLLSAVSLPSASSFGAPRPVPPKRIAPRSPAKRPSPSGSKPTRLSSSLQEQVDALVTLQNDPAIQGELSQVPAALREMAGAAGLGNEVEAAQSVSVASEMIFDGVLLGGSAGAMGGAEEGASGLGTFSYGDEMLQAAAAAATAGRWSFFERFMDTHLGPRALLAGASLVYATNFPLVAVMDESMPPSAATSARMTLAALALSPFLPKLDPSLVGSALLGGLCTATAIISQSVSLVTTSPATVAFLGAATVIVCPILECVFDRKPMGPSDAPQTWLAGALCLLGVGTLELWDPTGTAGGALSNVGAGDALALLQAAGFGASFFLTERMMRERPGQAVPIASVQVAVAALVSAAWCVADGWMGRPGGLESLGLPGLLMDPSMRAVAAAVAWTGIVSTALNRAAEATALGRVTSAETSVILTLELLWVPMLSAMWLSEEMGANDYVGGMFIVMACLANNMKPADFRRFLGRREEVAPL